MTLRKSVRGTDITQGHLVPTLAEEGTNNLRNGNTLRPDAEGQMESHDVGFGNPDEEREEGVLIRGQCAFTIIGVMK